MRAQNRRAAEALSRLPTRAGPPRHRFHHNRKGSLERRTSRLPLPEKTGSDRDEPHCPHGFVDRAYLVFCVELRTTSASTDYPDLPTRVPLTPFEVSSPIPSAVVGYEPQVIHHTHTKFDAVARGDSGDHRAQMEVPTRAWAACVDRPFPLERRAPQPRRPRRACTPYPSRVHRMARASALGTGNSAPGRPHNPLYFNGVVRSGPSLASGSLPTR